MMKIGAIILARFDSSRLPGKALRPIKGRPLLARVVDVCRATPGIDLTMLATTDRPVDDKLAAFAEEIGVPCFRGDVNNVAGRFLAAMESQGLDGAVRVNGDSPFNRPALLGNAVDIFRSGQFDLVSNVPGRTFPFGVSVEVVSRSAMKSVCQAMSAPDHREHVTKYLYDHPEGFRMHFLQSKVRGLGGIQLAVDSPDDLAQAEWLTETLGGRLLQADESELVELVRRFHLTALAGQS